MIPSDAAAEPPTSSLVRRIADAGRAGTITDVPPDVLVLALASVVRPTSAGAVYRMLSMARAPRLLLGFLVAGLLCSVPVGILAVAVVDGAGPARPTRTSHAALDVALGVVAVGYAVAVLAGRVRTSGRGTAGGAERRRELSVRGAAALGVATHLPGLIYLAALNAIARDATSLLDGVVQVLVYNALWFSLPAVALGFAVTRPEALRDALERVAGAVGRHRRGLVGTAAGVLGGYLIVKGLVGAGITPPG